MKTFKIITTGLFLLGTSFLLAETLPANDVPSVKEYEAIKTQKMLQNKEQTRLKKNIGNGQGNANGIMKQKNKSMNKNMSGQKQRQKR